MASQDDHDLFSYFSKSVNAVQTQADQFEQVYARPALQSSQAFFDERPITATFIAIFTLLSFFPVVSFIGFALLTIVSSTVLALICAFLFAMAVVLAALSLLVFSLLGILFLSICLTISLASLYTFARFIILLREYGKDGIWIWAAETREQILNTFSATPLVPVPTSGRDEWVEYVSESDGLNGHAIELKPEDDYESRPDEPVNCHECYPEDIKKEEIH